MRYSLLALLLVTAGCASAPTVSAYHEDSVTISSLAPSDDPAITAEASRLCAMNGRVANLIGASQGDTPDMTATMIMGVPVYPLEYLFACVEPV
jgi:photosystem II stability/assembly factor-like uncharacterized protein